MSLISCFENGAPSFDKYNAEVDGPILAVSDEGSAGPSIVEAAFGSAKARALWPLDALRLGLVVDGERMTSAGEAPIGPDEYHALNTLAQSLVRTTNVGVRVNLRLSQQLPEFSAADVSKSDALVGNIVDTFKPFLQTPNAHPRPLTIRLSIAPSETPDILTIATARLNAARSSGRIGPAAIHRFSALIIFDAEITSDEQIHVIEAAIDGTARAGLKELAIDAPMREDALQRIAVQSLLNILDVDSLRRLLAYANRAGVRLVYRRQFDAESAARTVWTGLYAARGNGFAAGKYGLLPLTLEEQEQVIERIARWTTGWMAIPAFYVDSPLVTAHDVYGESDCEAAAMLWLKMARGAGAQIVLFDSPDRVSPRRLLKTAETPNGVLSLEAVERIVSYSKDLGLSVLWSGGVSARQAFELAKRRVFGVFSTSSTATKVAVSAQFEDDPRLPFENEPSEFGVRRIHALIQGGFLSSALRGREEGIASTIERLSIELLDTEEEPENKLLALDDSLMAGWRALRAGKTNGVGVPHPWGVSHPVPADAVRVFRGRKPSGLSRRAFLDRLGATFMPMTVQMQRLFGLTAYLPAVPPANTHASVPDELALVFYRTQGAYREAKRSVGGRGYSELHELAFDMKASASGFPTLFAGALEFDRPYHLFIKSTDWQMGLTCLYVGERLPTLTPQAFAAGVADIARKLRAEPGPVDAAIFCVGEDWLAWWEHAPQTYDQDWAFDGLCNRIFASAARRLRPPADLTFPYAGLALSEDGDFLNFQFPRV